MKLFTLAIIVHVIILHGLLATFRWEAPSYIVIWSRETTTWLVTCNVLSFSSMTTSWIFIYCVMITQA